MLLQPKQLKYRKPHVDIPDNKRAITDKLNFGTAGLVALENAAIPANQLDAARKAIVNYVKRKGKLWMRVFPATPITKHPAETRMGSGKGSIDHYAALVKKGRILFEMGGVDEVEVREAFRRASSKLSVKVKVVLK